MKTPIFPGNYQSKWWIFHGYVSLRECSHSNKQWNSKFLWNLTHRNFTRLGHFNHLVKWSKMCPLLGGFSGHLEEAPRSSFVAIPSKSYQFKQHNIAGTWKWKYAENRQLHQLPKIYIIFVSFWWFSWFFLLFCRQVLVSLHLISHVFFWGVWGRHPNISPINELNKQLLAPDFWNHEKPRSVGCNASSAVPTSKKNTLGSTPEDFQQHHRCWWWTKSFTPW